MMREVSDRSILDDFAIRFSKVVEKHAVYVIVSGFVVISSGRARGTEDIDMIIGRLSKGEFGRLHEDLIKGGFVCQQSDKVNEVYSYLKDNLSVRYTLDDIPLPEMELKFVVDELDEYQLKTRKKLSETGLDLYFSSIEMNVAFKEEYLKSPKDLEDAKHLRMVYSIDEKEVEKIKQMLLRFRLK